jgi:SAM-dependent methyltransferase
MNPDRVFLLAFGHQQRLAHLRAPKQLLDVSRGEEILERTIRQVRRTWPQSEIIVVAPHEPIWIEFATRHMIPLATPTIRGETVVETIRQLAPDGGDRLFLLGDVIFSDAAFRIMKGTSGSAFFAREHESRITGRPGEFFGLYLGPEQPPITLELGRLRDLHAHLQLPLIEIDDFTDDVDSPDDLAGPLDAIRVAVAYEEAGMPPDRQLLASQRFWTCAGGFPPNKEEVYPEHAIAQEFNRFGRGTEVLEYGCGGGSDAMSYLRRGCRVYAADIVQDNLTVTRDRARAAGLSEALCLVHLGQSDAIPLADDSVDVASAHGVLHHIQSPIVERTVKEIYRVLKPGGTFYSMLYTPALELHHAERIAQLRAQHPGLTHEEAFGWATDGQGCPFAEAYDHMKATATFELCGFRYESVFCFHNDFFATYRWKKPS